MLQKLPGEINEQHMFETDKTKRVLHSASTSVELYHRYVVNANCNKALLRNYGNEYVFRITRWEETSASALVFGPVSFFGPALEGSSKVP